MELDGREMTNEELDLHTAAMLECIRILLKTADEMNADRNSYMVAATKQLEIMSEVCTFDKFDLQANLTKGE